MTITSVNDGSSDKFYRAWADSADGSKGFSTTDSSKEYFGVYAGITPPSNYKAYSWTKIKGDSGRSVTDTEMEYAINDSKTTPPTSGWSLEMPVWKTGLFIWQRVKVSYSTGNPSYTTPHCLESNIIDDVTGNIGDWIFKDKTEILSGTEIFTDKADEEALVHVEVDGKSYQHLNPNARNMIPTAYKDWEDGHYSTSGAKEPYVARIRVPWLVKVEPNTTYHWNSGDSSTHFVIRSFDNSGAFSGSWGGIGASGSRTTSSSEHYLGIAFYNISNYEEKFSNGAIKPLFQLASHSDKSFEEFVPPAPTPEYPIEIHSLNDFDVVSSVGKRNLAKANSRIANTKEFTLSTWAGQQYSNLEVREIFKEGRKYTVSYDAEIVKRTSEPTKFSDTVALYLYSPSGGVTQYFSTSGLNNLGDKRSSKTTFTCPPLKDDHVILAYTRRFTTNGESPVGFDTVKFTNLRIVESSEETLYSPSPEDISESDNHPLIDKINLLLDEPLRSIGDVKDRLFRDTDGLWKIERKTTERIISGGMLSYRYRLGAQGINTFYNSNFPNAKIGYRTSISSHFKNVQGGWDRHEHGVGYSDHTSTVNKYFYFPDSLTGITESDSTSIATQKINNWLALNPISVVYQLANPTIEILSQSLQDKLNNLRSFKDSNYIYTVLSDKSNILSENLKPTLHATFKSIAWANDFKYKFEQAKAMHSTDIWFAKGVSNTIAPNIGWSTDAPVWEDGLYIWSKTITTYGDGRTEETSPVCITGATGRSVDKIEEWYYLSNKSNSLEGGTWSKTPPTWTDGKYIWTKNKIIYKNPSGSEETAPINNTGGSGQKGETGTDARTVRLNNVIHAVHFDQDGLMPSVTSIAFPTAVQGFSGVTPYYEFKMGDTIVRGLSTDSSWTLNTSAMKYSDFPLAVTVNVVISGQTLATDTATIVGTKPGEDAYTVVLANESHTFAGDVSNAIAGSTTANVIAYRGGTQVGATIGNITGLPTGMTSTVYSNGTTSARVTFTVTTSMKSPNGVVNIPVTVNGKSFTKVFNYAIAFKGAKGDKGTDGIAGKDGVGIKATVLAYASSTSGTTTPTSGWTTTVPTVAPGNYLWTRTTWTYTDNSTENGYSVSRIGKDGNTGNDGVAGKDGVGIKSTVIHYGGSTSGTSHSGVAWTTAIPSVPNGQFLWTRTTWTYDDNTTETGYSVAKMGETGAKGDKGDKGDRGSDGIAGKDGVGIKTTTLNYVSSTNGTTAPTSGWTATIPTVAAGNYLWTRTTWTYTDNSVENGYTVSRIGKDGNTGKDGVAGKDGVGLTSTTITYAASTSGTTAPTSGWATTVPTVAVGSFLWTRTVWTYTDGTNETGYSVGKMGNTGPTGATGATGERGPKGDTGTSVSSVTEFYLATSSNSGVTTSTSGWTTTIQTMTATNKYLWNYEQINFSDGTNQPTLPVIIGAYGDKGQTGSTGATGRSITGITEHYLASNLATGVTRTTSGWTTTMQQTDPTKKYLWNYETITWSSGTTTTYVEPIIIGVHGEQGPQGATGARGPQGATGTSVSSITEYYLATSASSGVTTSTSGWVTTMPTMTTTNKYLWNYEKVNFSDGTNQPTIPVIIGVHGATGATGGTGATGRSITAITEHYLATASASGVTRSTSGWSTTMQSTTTTNKYLWNYETITWNSAPTTTYVEPIIIGVHGATGSTGAKGDKGNPGENATARNFLLDSKPSSIIHTAAYNIADFILAEAPVSGEIYSFVLKGELASTKTNFSIYNTDGSSPLGTLSHKGNGIYSLTFPWIYGGKERVKVYAMSNSQTGNSKIEWVTMVKGSVPLTEWVPAHEDIYKYVDDIEVGGRNLILNSYSLGMTGSDNGNKDVTTFQEGVHTITPIYNGNVYRNLEPSMELIKGYEYTLSFDVLTNTAIGVYWYADTGGGTYSGGRIPDTKGEWIKHEFTYTQARDSFKGTFLFGLHNLIAGSVVKYRNVKLEKGNKATDWSPAPEDLYQYVDDIEVGGDNLLRVGEWSNYSSYNTIPRVTNGGRTITYVKNNNNSVAIRNTTLEYGPNVYYTLSGYAKINGTPVTNATWGVNRLASTYQGEVTHFSIRDSDGYFVITQNWTANSQWLLHGSSIMHSSTGTITIDDFMVQRGTKATSWKLNPLDAKGGGRNYALGTQEEITTGGWANFYDLSPDKSDLNGVPATVSFWAKHESGSSPVALQAYYRTPAGNNLGYSYGSNQKTTTSYQKFVIPIDTAYIPSDLSGYSTIAIRKDDSTNIISIKGVKLEAGYGSTDYSPAIEDVQSSIGEKADSSATEAALNEAAAKLQVLQQEVEAAATSNELKDFIDKYNKDMASRDKDARESESSLSDALTSIDLITTNMGDMSETWQFIDRFIKNTPEGMVIGNDSSGSYILIKEDRLSFYSNGQEVAFISQNLMEISRGAFVEQIQIAKYQFEESTTNHLTVRFVG